MDQSLTSKKIYRHRYFSIEIHTGVEGSQISQLTDTRASLLNLLEKTNFITQEQLHTVFQHLMKSEENSKSVLQNFIGQLESKPNERLPFWKISCQTSFPTTAIRLARILSEELFPSPNPDSRLLKSLIDGRIRVRCRESLEKLSEKLRMEITDSNWFPGYLTPKFVNLMTLLDLMEDSEILEEIGEKVLVETIQARPKVCQTLTKLGKAGTPETGVQ
jgi:hypothetical protein